MKKFTLYYFKADDEGGYGVCKSKDFTPMRDYRPQTGWRNDDRRNDGHRGFYIIIKNLTRGTHVPLFYYYI